jgi:hypothetical protein
MDKHTLANSPRSLEPSSSDARDLIARTIAACTIAKRHAHVFGDSAVQYLRAIREAGRLLALVELSRGGRPSVTRQAA